MSAVGVGVNGFGTWLLLAIYGQVKDHCWSIITLSNTTGRIGRLVTRAALQRDDLNVVAINDPLMSAQDMAYLLKYDTTQGTLPNNIQVDGNDILVDGHRIRCTSHATPADISWGADVQLVCEASGKFLDVARCVCVGTYAYIPQTPHKPHTNPT